jgi:hypothetical protein
MACEMTTKEKISAVVSSGGMGGNEMHPNLLHH